MAWLIYPRNRGIEIAFKNERKKEKPVLDLTRLPQQLASDLT